jgi:hypothetical protein
MQQQATARLEKMLYSKDKGQKAGSKKSSTL